MGIEVAARAGIDLHDRRTGGADALGIDRGGLMPDKSGRDDDLESLAQARRVNLACERFEQAWRAGEEACCGTSGGGAGCRA